MRFSSIIPAAVALGVANPCAVFAAQITVAPSGGNFTTVAAGIAAAHPGDVVLVRAGVYHEAASFGQSGSAAAYITLQGDPGAVLDGTGISGRGITIASRNYIKVIGMTVRNFKSGDTPMGIDVEGSSSHIELRNNLVYSIESPNANAHGIAFYGTASTPMTNIVVDGNEIRNCRLGQSESLVLNGNIDGFTVSRNTVHDNDNIGIDFIGFEGTGPTGSDQARNGSCVDNVVYNISSATNPTYGGDRSADGLYVDGGRDIVIERNKVDNCDIGIEAASEHSGKATSNITVRNNFVSRSYLGNILMGGYASTRGNAVDVIVVNNTTYGGNDDEIELQYNCNRVTIKNNILYAQAGRPYISRSGSNDTNVTVDNNLYFGASSSSPGSYPDAHARFVNPLLVALYMDLHLQLGSPAIDAGINLGLDAQGQPISGTSDIDGRPRVQGIAINLGAHELGIGTLPVPAEAPALAPALGGFRPNPAGAAPCLEFTLPNGSPATLEVFDVAGRRWLSRDVGMLGAGRHTLSWEGPALEPGVYVVRLIQAGRTVSARGVVRR